MILKSLHVGKDGSLATNSFVPPKPIADNWVFKNWKFTSTRGKIDMHPELLN